MASDEPPLVDEFVRIGSNDWRITQRATGDWLVSKYPLERNDPGWPGSIFSSLNDGCPNGPDLDAMIEWAQTQSRETP